MSGYLELETGGISPSRAWQVGSGKGSDTALPKLWLNVFSCLVWIMSGSADCASLYNLKCKTDFVNKHFQVISGLFVNKMSIISCCSNGN